MSVRTLSAKIYIYEMGLDWGSMPKFAYVLREIICNIFVKKFVYIYIYIYMMVMMMMMMMIIVVVL